MEEKAAYNFKSVAYQRSALSEFESGVVQKLYGILYEFSTLNRAYSSEDHQKARKHVEDALSIMKNLVERSRGE